MTPKDWAEFRQHPEWFEVTPLSVPRMALEAYRRLPAAVQKEYADAISNPPLLIKRKPVPFVLPIRGAS